MAVVASDGGHSVALVGTPLDEEILRSIEEKRLHPKLGVTLSPNVTAYRWERFGEALERGADLLILGVSSAGIDWVVDQIVAVVVNALPVLMITKGLAPKEASIEVFPSVVARELERRKGLRLPVMAVAVYML